MEQISLDLENGNKVHFKKHPRYGSWSVNFDKGGIPSSLEGEFLSLDELKRKVNYYLSIREKNKTRIKDG